MLWILYFQICIQFLYLNYSINLWSHTQSAYTVHWSFDNKLPNFIAGQPPESGHLHPLLKVRSEFREIFLEMGFTEMPTNNYVESSFWNFDALFQPQQHPARDAHDTFFVSNPAVTTKFPMDYLERVKKVHSEGGYGSQVYAVLILVVISHKRLWVLLSS